MGKKYVILITIFCVGLVIIRSKFDDRTIAEFWNSKSPINSIDIKLFPISIESLEWYEGVRVINSMFYSMLPYCNKELSPKCFDEFLQIGDMLFYSKETDKIRIERKDDVFIFSKYE